LPAPAVSLETDADDREEVAAVTTPRRWTSAALGALVLATAGCGGSKGPPQQVVTTGSSPASAPPAAARTVQDRFVQVVRDVSPEVVQIQTSQGLGSGVIFDDKGNIVTNNHVVGGASTFTVTLSDGKSHRATLVGSFPQGDLAVIRLQGVTPKPATFGDSSKLAVGQISFAIGNPLGLRSSVTQGIISSLGRTVSEGPNGAVITSAIQTSAPINPGNSGGALVDLDGAVVGIPTLAALDPELGGSAAPGIGFAIPSNTATRVARQLIASGRVTQTGRGYLGVRVASGLQGQGVLIAAVERGGPADKAGVRPGEVIVAVNHVPTPTAEDLTKVLAELKPGQKVPVDLIDQNGAKRTVEVTLGELPAG
jgi:S1-C subfamily serine protease